jgi:hypothetical protein
MKFNIIATESQKANAYALFFVKKSVQFSTILSENGKKQVESVLNGMKDGPFEDLEFLEIDGKPTFFVDAAKERGLSALDHLRMAAYRLAGRAHKLQHGLDLLHLAGHTGVHRGGDKSARLGDQLSDVHMVAHCHDAAGGSSDVHTQRDGDRGRGRHSHGLHPGCVLPVRNVHTVQVFQ